MPDQAGPSSEAQDESLIEALFASSSKAVGEAYFPVMVETLAKTLSVRWVLVSTLIAPDCRRVRTVAAWDNGPAENFEYDLDQTPCANIVAQGVCVFPDKICELFPEDQMLQDMGAQSYVGTPLRSTAGDVIGLLVALDDKPIEDIARAQEIIELFSGRAAAEIERLVAASLNERLGRIVENSVSEVFTFNGDTYQFELVNRGARDNLGYSMDELRNLTPWDLKPEFSREEFIRFVQPLREGSVPTLTFETVHERKDGTRYDVAVQLQYFAGVDNVFYASINDVTDRKRADEARAHLAAIVASSSEAIISKGLDGVIRSWNNGAERIFGYSAAEIVGKSINLLIPADRQAEEEDLRARLRRGEAVRNYETVRVCKDGQHVDVSANVSPIFDAAGKIVGASSIAHDISEQKRTEARERLLTGEINHRAKNLLSLVQVIARQSAASDPVSFAQRFEERILALSASHDVLVNNGWQDVPLDELVRSQLGHFKSALGTRILMSGPALKITANAAQAIGMALHELATNAAKYGALSGDRGEVEISWHVDGNRDEDLFQLTWTERNGPSVVEPSTRGFGSKVIERILQSRIAGDVAMVWLPGGLVCRVTCNASSVLDSEAEMPPAPEATIMLSQPPTDDERRILVVEDETLIAIEISECLRNEGFSVLGPVSSVNQAISLLAVEPCHAGILDINLGNETSEAIASRLKELNCPFLTVSSCNLAERPDVYADLPHLLKPVRTMLLLEKLHRMLEKSAIADPCVLMPDAAEARPTTHLD